MIDKNRIDNLPHDEQRVPVVGLVMIVLLLGLIFIAVTSILKSCC